MASSPQLPLVLAITGASGAPYAVRLLEVLLAAGREIHLSISTAGQAVFLQEIGRPLDLDRPDPAILLGAAFERLPAGALDRSNPALADTR